MERRKFVIGLGSIAAGGAAAMGSGAFTSVEAERSIDVEVADDASAYLTLEAADHPNGEQYVDDEGDTVEIDITETVDENENTLGEGLNPNATTVIEDLLVVRNQGTEDGVGVWVDVDFETSLGDGDFTVYDQDQGVDTDLEEEAVEVDSGNSLNIAVEIETGDPAELDGDVRIHGDKRENQWPQN